MQDSDDRDWIVRQVKSFGRGLGNILSHGKSNAGTEIVFPQKDSSRLPHKKELQDLIDEREYYKAAMKLKVLRYSMEEENFIELSKWFYKLLFKIDEPELNRGNYSRKVIVEELKKIENMESELE